MAKPPTQQAKAAASDKVRTTDRDWLSAKELATAIGWRAHTLRDALRGRRIAGVRMTSHGYSIDKSAVAEVAALLGPAPARHPKANGAQGTREASSLAAGKITS
ncbi:MAG: hypothetical protein E6I87_12365 [Chloroflexi bacterium]|nr:MAG: hypothetical protein E6I87_12365 [Chloroflexota bacterium]